VYRLDDGSRFGLIIALDEADRFPNGVVRPAYRVLAQPDDRQTWIAAETAESAPGARREE
jgi:hypothetical protein